MINPNWLKRIDNYLLTHFPLAWISRIHYVIYYSVLLVALIGLIAFLSPLPLSGRIENESWYSLICIVSVTAAVIWMVHLLRFNLVKQFGRRSAGDEYINFILYFLCFTIFASYAFVYPLTQTLKVSAAFTEKELEEDINAINLGNYFFIPDSFHRNFPTDLKLTEDSYSEAYSIHGDTFYNLNAHRIENLYFSYDDDKKHGLQLRTSYQNYVLYKDISTREARLAAIRRFIELSEKYYTRLNCSAEDVLAYWTHAGEYGAEDEELYSYMSQERRNLEDTVRNIVKLKYSDYEFMDRGFLHAWWYFLFFCTVMTLIYKNVRGRAYLFSLLSGMLLPILFLLFINMTIRDHHDEYMFLLIMLTYSVCGISTLSTFFQTRYSHFSAVCIILFMVLTPVIGLVFVEYNWHWSSFTSEYGSEEYDTWFRSKKEAMRVAEYAGFIMFFGLLQPVFKHLLVKLYSLPQKE